MVKGDDQFNEVVVGCYEIEEYGGSLYGLRVEWRSKEVDVG